jgi:hypothetical protein
MTLPANIRINVGAPFPATVKGTAGIGIGRANGIWTIGLAYPQFGIRAPSPVNTFATSYVLIFDSALQTYFMVPLSSLVVGGVQRSVTAGPVTILATDRILNLNLSASLTIPLPPAISRGGVPLVFKDIGRQASSNPITIAATPPDTIDGNPSIIMTGAGQRLTLNPANDGVNSGWSL